MEFNQTTIGLLLFYTTGLLLMIFLFLIALPTLIHGPKDSPTRKAAAR